MAHNPNCCGGKCRAEQGEVRVLPGNADSNLILCRVCFDYEIRYRKDRNRELAADMRYDLPTWDSLKVYGGAD